MKGPRSGSRRRELGNSEPPTPDPPREGDPGYSAHSLAEIDANRCPCDGQPLTDRALSPAGWAHCRVCRCAWKPVLVDGQRHPFRVPSRDCPLGRVALERWERDAEQASRRARGE